MTQRRLISLAMILLAPLLALAIFWWLSRPVSIQPTANPFFEFIIFLDDKGLDYRDYPEAVQFDGAGVLFGWLEFESTSHQVVATSGGPARYSWLVVEPQPCLEIYGPGLDDWLAETGLRLHSLAVGDRLPADLDSVCLQADFGPLGIVHLPGSSYLTYDHLTGSPSLVLQRSQSWRPIARGLVLLTYLAFVARLSSWYVRTGRELARRQSRLLSVRLSWIPVLDTVFYWRYGQAAAQLTGVRSLPWLGAGLNLAAYVGLVVVVIRLLTISFDLTTQIILLIALCLDLVPPLIYQYHYNRLPPGAGRDSMA